MFKTCASCTQQFEITAEDLAFYKKISPVIAGKTYEIPPPTLCPKCRQKRRLAFRNERTLYKRECNATGKPIIAAYAPAAKCPVYDQSFWWSDNWDALKYGRPFDFSRPFFEQFAELMNEVPRISVINKEHENSEYCNFALRNKNCYLLFTSAECQDSFYSNRAWKSRDICDCSNVVNCECCYEVIDSNNCYNCTWLQNCSNCSDCYLSYNLKGCRNCFACYGLVSKQYCINNQQYNKEDYVKKLTEMQQNLDEITEQFEKNKQNAPRKYADIINSENCSGGSLANCKNCLECYECQNSEDCKYVCNATHQKDSYDTDNDDHSELIYEAVGSESNYHNLFNDICWFDKEIMYCSLCFHSQNLFGCVGLKRAQYCILNRQYSKDEYEKLLPRIIEHMKDEKPNSSNSEQSEPCLPAGRREGGGFKSGRPSGGGDASPYNQELGEFFPVKISPFAYNETVAQDYFPLSKDEAMQKGYRWRDADAKEYKPQTYIIPPQISEVPDTITSEILACSCNQCLIHGFETCAKNYRITPQELALYRKLNLYIPGMCPDCRHRDRLTRRCPRQLWQRMCQCGKEIQSTYAPSRPEKVYCEECYLKNIY